MIGHTPDAIPDTPQHLSEFDGRYMRDFVGEIIMRSPDDSHQHTVVNYSKIWKLVEEARGSIPMQCARIWALIIDSGMSFILTFMPLPFLYQENQDHQDAVH